MGQARRIRTGLIGFGLGGQAFHAPLIQAVEGLELAAVATSRAELVHARAPGVAVTDADALIADPTIDLVVISTPNETHAPLSLAALRAGKHVVIDKPFATRLDDAEAIAAAADAVGRLAIPFHNRRWDSDFLTIRALMTEGTLGTLSLFESRWDRFRPALRGNWKDTADGGGLLLDLGPHLIDQALLLFGMPDALHADIAAQRIGSPVDDYFEITLHYGSMRAILSAASIVPAPRPRFSIHGELASFVKHGLDPQEGFLRDGGDAGDPRLGVEREDQYGALMFGGDTARQETRVPERGDYRRFYAGVREAIASGAPPPVKAAEAIAGLRLIGLARRSAREGRRFACRPSSRLST